MLTPQEAEAHVFPKASFGGYAPQQVDTFLDTLIEDYRTLYQENLSLKNKMKILVDKVEEYRATEDAMRMTLHSAQKMAEAMVKEGEAKRQAAIDDAAAAAEQHSAEIRAGLEQEEQAIQARVTAVRTDLANEQARLDAARVATSEYLDKLRALYSEQIAYIGSLSELTAEPPAEEAAPAEAPAAPAQPVEPAPAAPSVPAEERQEEVAQDIEASMAKIFDGSDVTEPKGDLGDTRVFDQIQFGKDYEIE